MIALPIRLYPLNFKLKFAGLLIRFQERFLSHQFNQHLVEIGFGKKVNLTIGD
jgi:hypothetical protein